MKNIHLIYLRRFDIEKDLDLFHQVHSDPSSVKYYGMFPLSRFEQSRNMINAYIDSEYKNKSIHRVICSQTTNKYMGEIGLFNINTTHHRANAYCILLPEYRKRGISLEASILLYDEVFRTMQINRIQALVDCRNNTAKESLKGIGFSYEGKLSQYEFFDGEYIDMDLFALLKENFYDRYF